MTQDVQLESWVRDIVTLTAESTIAKYAAAIAEHAETCEAKKSVQRLEVRFGQLVGFMLGSGLLGGGAGAVIAKMVG